MREELGKAMSVVKHSEYKHDNNKNKTQTSER